MGLISFIVSLVIGYYATFVPAWALRTAGFGSTGVRPKTLAASYQAKYKGVVPRNSIFATFQQWGMTGVPPFVTSVSFFVGNRLAAWIF
ncbi:hypothetical protein MTO96_003778 [Rhipicephalus appendiculatus]|uniref:Uncharacterized protein n=1 Tax=Rhipicephalus appendiculatus TaxID=34631 RepID=A0A131YIF6_RHIAP